MMSPLTPVMSTCLGGFVNRSVSPAFYSHAEVNVFDPPHFSTFNLIVALTESCAYHRDFS